MTTQTDTKFVLSFEGLKNSDTGIVAARMLRSVFNEWCMEWALDSESQELTIVQARPETVQSQKVDSPLQSYRR